MEYKYTCNRCGKIILSETKNKDVSCYNNVPDGNGICLGKYEMEIKKPNIDFQKILDYMNNAKENPGMKKFWMGTYFNYHLNLYQNFNNFELQFVISHSDDEYHDHYPRYQGYMYAKDMAKKGEIAFTHNFGCSCGHYAFQYGGFWVCNGCGGKNVDEEWWKIKVKKDGDKYCCHGLDFENIMESENFSFDKTYEEAIANYRKLMRKNKN